MNIEYVDINKLIPHPDNPNKHSADQIKRLASIIKYQNWRLPIIVSVNTGYVVSGHGRLQAAKQLKLKEVPVSYQDFLSTEQEYAFLVSDNAIASWAELDLSAINSVIPDLGPDFDIDLLGLQNFTIIPEFEPGTEEEQGKLDEKKPVITQCPNCGECFDANENKSKN